jgi:hypothetical protein
MVTVVKILFTISLSTVGLEPGIPRIRSVYDDYYTSYPYSGVEPTPEGHVGYRLLIIIKTNEEQEILKKTYFPALL